MNNIGKSDSEPASKSRLEQCKDLITSGKIDEAISSLTELMMDSTSPEVSALLAEAYRRAGDSQEAELIQSLPEEKWKSIKGRLIQVRAFVYDRHPAVLTSLRQMLEPRSYEVFLFTRSNPCRRCRCNEGENCADMMFCDLALLKDNGDDFQQVQKRKGCKIRNVVVMSENWKKEDLDSVRAMGFLPLQKPVTVEPISAWLDECEQKINPDRVLSNNCFKYALS
mgnify:CR=1 FL=1